MSTMQGQPGSQGDNTYVIDSESAVEMARLMRQDCMLTKEMGGLFPEGVNLTGVQSILDIACGPGGWVLETAFAHSDIEVVGVDISQKMIAYANAQAKVQGLGNANFRVMNALKPLDFPGESFDLVNARLISVFMLPEIWPKFLQECLRILRPGGILLLTDVEAARSNKFALERMMDLFNRALYDAGQSFSPTGTQMGILPILRRLLSSAGCQNIGRMAHAVELSYGTEMHESFYHNGVSFFKLLQPFITKWKLAAQEELDTLYQQALAEMQSEDFCALWVMLTVWGYKPR